MLVGTIRKSAVPTVSRAITRISIAQSSFLPQIRRVARCHLNPSPIRTAAPLAFTSSALHRQYGQEARARRDGVDDKQHQTSAPEDEAAEPKTFQDLLDRRLVNSNIMRAVMGDMRLQTMSDVQQQSMLASLAGRDIIAQARTGTGKTLAFLLPIMQHIIKEDSFLGSPFDGPVSAQEIRGIIVSPTRELAEQIGMEAKRVARHTGIRVQLAVGGTQRSSMLRQAQRQGCHLLVGTPGRLKDLLSDPTSGIAAPKLVTFVLDEADRLVDAGFLPEIEQIKELIPGLNQGSKQTMMLSATISHKVVDLVRQTLRPGFKFVQCVDPNEPPTHQRVPQRLVSVTGLENMYLALYELVHVQLKEQQQQQQQQQQLDPQHRPFKAMIFFNSAADVILMVHMLRSLRSIDPLFADISMYEIHSRLSQAQRTYASDCFRRSKSAILLSTDVTARGLDFPEVTHVIQVGIPAHGGRDSYVHRLGRTGRAGKEGTGYIIVPELERSRSTSVLAEFPLERDHSLGTADLDLTRPIDATDQTENLSQAVKLANNLRKAFQRVNPSHMETAYLGYLGMYSTYPSRKAIDSINNLVKYGWGQHTPISVPASLARKLGYSNTDLSIQTESRSPDGDFRRRSDRGSSFGGSSDRRFSNRFSSSHTDDDSRLHDIAHRSSGRDGRYQRSGNSYGSKGGFGDRQNRGRSQAGNRSQDRDWY